MDQIWYEYTKTNVILYFSAGLPCILPPWFAIKPKWYKILWYLYKNFTDLILYAITVTNFIGAVLLTDIFDVLSSLPPLIHGIQLSGRLICLHLRMRAVEEYIEELNDVLTEDLRNTIENERNFQEIHQADFRMNRILTILEFFSLIMSNLFFFVPECVKSFINPEEAHAIIVSWYPYDIKVNVNKQITNVVHTVSWLLINYKMASFDTMFQSLIILHTSQFRQLRYIFGKIMVDDDSGLGSFGYKKNGELNSKLQWWIGQHQRTLSITKKLEILFKPLLFFSYIECLSNMCLCAFLATVQGSSWTVMQRFSAVCVVATVFLQMFVMCRLGDYLEESSVLVPDLGYNISIFRSTHKIQKSMVMILHRMNLPVRFSAMNMFYMNSKYYAMLAQGVFSYYMALRQLQSRN